MRRGRRLSPDALERLEAYDWPGNVRELRHAVERATILASGERLEVGDFPFLTAERYIQAAETLDLDGIECQAIKRALTLHQGNISHAATALGPDPACSLSQDGEAWALAMRASLFALGLGLRAAIVGVIAFTVIQLLSLGHYYATAFVLTGIAFLILADVVRSVLTADRMLGRFLDSIATGSVDRPPAAGHSTFRRTTDAIARKVAALGSDRAKGAGQIDYFQALSDTAPIILLVVEPDGSIVLANRAAHQFAGHTVSRLGNISAVGQKEGGRAPGAWSGGSRDSALGERPARLGVGDALLPPPVPSGGLISLQNIETELDAVELKAWQDLVRILSHEIMNSLTPISSLAESLGPLARELGAASGPNHAQAANDITVAADTIARRSAGLIDFVERYRKTAALPQPNLQTIRIDDLAIRLKGLIGPYLASKAIAWESVIDPPDLSMTADPDLIEQALINLLHNAVEAVAHTSEPQMILECRRLDAEHVAISVADNGKGIDADIRDKIFLPFYTTKAAGSGIGLSLCRNIALAHGGQLDVSARLPQGTVVTLICPSTAANLHHQRDES